MKAAEQEELINVTIIVDSPAEAENVDLGNQDKTIAAILFNVIKNGEYRVGNYQECLWKW